MMILKDLKLESQNQKLQSCYQWKKLLWSSNWFRYKTIWEIRKLTTGQYEDHTAGCLLDYHYIKNDYRLIAVDLIRQKELDADPKVIHQIEFVWLLKM